MIINTCQKMWTQKGKRSVKDKIYKNISRYLCTVLCVESILIPNIAQLTFLGDLERYTESALASSCEYSAFETEGYEVN